MNRTPTTRSHSRRFAPSSGFTLVEMLVSVTLVLLMMVMFGEIFQIASGSVTKQRVISDNDQNVRTFVTVFRADLDKRTMRSVVPFFPGELSSNPGTPFGSRRGYFSLSFNNPTDGTDDVVQFTTLVTNDLRNVDETPYFGRAIPLIAGAGGTPALNFLANDNQPDRDDGQITANEAGSSKAAEVVYFMRGKRLYRRALLLRDPVTPTKTNLGNPAQPTYLVPGTDTRIDYFLPTGIYDTQSAALYGSIGFWRDFDYSAHRSSATLPLPINAVFNGIDALSNDPTKYPYPGHPWMPALGQTWNRFGYNHEVVLGAPVGPVVLTNGLPREFTTATASPATPVAFIGRFTQEETSCSFPVAGALTGAGAGPSFRYPQALSATPTPPGAWNGNPMDAAGTELTLNAESGAVNEFQPNSTFSRPGVDLLLAHVHEFRVELWDERLGMFVVPGHGLSDVAPGDDGIFGTPDDTAPGDYNLLRQQNPTFAPLGGLANVYDTWHPQFNRDANFIPDPAFPADPNKYQPVLSNPADRPPYRPLKFAPVGTGNAGAIPPGPTPGGPYLASYWAPATAYAVGAVVFPRTEDLNANGELDVGEDGVCGFPANGLPDASPNGFSAPSPLKFPPFGLTYSYRCIKAGTSALSTTNEPGWRSTPGRVAGYPADVDLNSNGNLNDPGDIDYNGNGIADPAEPDWICEYNVRPLRAIRVTVRFQHPQSLQMRQVTIVHSLRDTTVVP